MLRLGAPVQQIECEEHQGGGLAGLHRGLQIGEVGDAILPNEADFAGLKFRWLRSFGRGREGDAARILSASSNGGSIILSSDICIAAPLSISDR